jgi:hypothetical protein
MTTLVLQVPTLFRLPRLLSMRLWIVRDMEKLFSIWIVYVIKPPGSSIVLLSGIRSNLAVGAVGCVVGVGERMNGDVGLGDKVAVSVGTRVAVWNGVGTSVAVLVGVGSISSPDFVGTGVNNCA